MKLKDPILQLRQGHIWRLKVSRSSATISEDNSSQFNQITVWSTLLTVKDGQTTHDLNPGALFFFGYLTDLDTDFENSSCVLM